MSSRLLNLKPENPIMKTSSLFLLLSFLHSARAVVPDHAEADVIIGRQPASASNFNRPCLAVDQATQKIFVGDQARNRILRFSSAASLQNGAGAEAVLGQADFTSIAPGAGPDHLNGPQGLWCDTSGRLWVADSGNNRVLRFNNAATISSGASANGVLGQVNFTNSAPGVSASSLRYPQGLVTDNVGHLYVADTSNHRVLRFSSAASLANGAPASGVLGHPDFITRTLKGSAADTLSSPVAVAISPNPVPLGQPYLWVAEVGNNRVHRLRYYPAPARP